MPAPTSGPEPPPTPRLDVTRGGGVTVARIAGCTRLAGPAAATLGRELAALAREPLARWLVIDLAGVEAAGPTGLRALLAVRQLAAGVGVRAALVNVRPGVRTALRAAGADALFRVLPAAG